MRFYLRGNETVLGTDPNHTADQSKAYLENNRNHTQSVIRQELLSFLGRGAHMKNSLKIGTFPFSNRTRNRTRTGAD